MRFTLRSCLRHLNRCSTAEDRYFISEIEIYDADGNNIALDAELYVSKEYNSSGYKVNDGKKDKHSWNYWQVGSAAYAGTYPDPHAVFSWDEPVEIHKIVIYEYADEIAFSVTDYSLDYELNKKIESVSVSDCSVSPEIFTVAGTGSVAINIDDVQTSYKVKVEEIKAGTLDPTLTPAIWFDASSIEAEDGATVSALENKANPGTNDASQAVASQMPVYTESSSINGKPALSFDGYASFDIADTKTNFDAMTIVMMANFSSLPTDGEQHLVSKWATSGCAWRWVLNTDKLSFGTQTAWGTRSLLDSSSTLSANEGNVLAVKATRVNGINTLLYQNGNLIGSGSQNIEWSAAGNTLIKIGASVDSTNQFSSFSGDVSEILIYNRALTDEELASVNKYLNEKWLAEPEYIPADVAIWYDASDIEATDGSSISAIENKANPGTFDASQETAASQPTYVSSSAVNGKSALRFDSADSLAVLGSESFANAPLTVLAVVSPSSVTADGSIASKYGTEKTWRFHLDSGIPTVTRRTGWSAPTLAAETAIGTDEASILGMNIFIANGVSNTYLYKNGEVIADSWLQSELAGSTSTPITIGASSAASGFVGDISEIMIFNKTLSDDELAEITAYLAEKWEIITKEAVKPDGAMTYDGFSVRTTSYNGLRSVFYFDDTAEYPGYTLKEYGALAVASVNKPTDGIYLSESGSDIVAVSSGIAKISVKKDGETVGKILKSEYSGKTKFAFSVVNYSAENIKKQAYICGYEVWTNNTTGDNEIIYTEYSNPSYRDISLYDMSLDMYKSGFLNSENEDGVVWDTLTTAGSVTLNEGTDYLTSDGFGNTFEYTEIPVAEQTSTAADGITFAETDITVTLIEDGESYVAFYRGNSGSIPAADIYGGMLPQLSSGFAQPSQYYSGKISAAPSPTLTYDTSMKIKTVVVDSGISRIGSYAFSGCGLEALVYPASCTVIGTGAFAYAAAFKTAHIAGGVAAEGVADMSGIEEFALDGYCLFRGCTSLEKICIADGASVGGVKFAEGATSLLGVWCESGKCAEGVIDLSTSGATKIGNGAFGNCAKITAIKLPASVTDIADDAFEGITNIEIIQE